MKPPANPDLPIQSDASSQDPSALAEYQHDENEFQARVHLTHAHFEYFKYLQEKKVGV